VALVLLAATFTASCRWALIWSWHRTTIGIGLGAVGVDRWSYDFTDQPPLSAVYSVNGVHLVWWWSWEKTASYRGLSIPIWMPFALVMLLTTAAWLPDVIASRRTRKGVCANCGYDRTGLAASAVCPECGLPVPSA